MEKKRERGKNYTEQEKESLLEIIKEFYNIIENKQTDGSSVKLKNEAWEAIADQYNATAQTGIRSVSQLRLLYDCIKKKAKKDKANEKVEIYKTGGGSSKGQMDAIGEKVLALNGANSTLEIINIYDSDAPFDKLLQAHYPNSEAIMNQENENEGDKPNILQENDVLAVRESNQVNLRPGIPYHKNKVRKVDKNTADKENIKLDILRIRKEKEELSRDILKLEKRKLQLEIREKVLKLKKEYGSDFNSD